MPSDGCTIKLVASDFESNPDAYDENEKYVDGALKSVNQTNSDMQNHF